MKHIDSHCHIHDVEFFPDSREDVYVRSLTNEVGVICVGTSEKDSRAAVEFVQNRDLAWAVVGVHPHDTKHGIEDVGKLLAESPQKVVGIGEIGLDYFYTNSPREVQTVALEQQLQWAVDYNLPVSFHVRNGFDDFWPIFDNFHGINGVLHSFTDSQVNLEKAYERGLFIGVNGISTFTKNPAQRELYARIPLSKILLETDAPFLTPAPFRGKINEPSYVVRVAEHMAALRDVPVSDVSAITTDNAKRLFDI